MAGVGPFKRWFGRTVRRVLGWKATGVCPPFPKFVIVAAPHTSNWDFVVMMAIAWELGLQFQWVGKHTLFVGPLGWLLRRLGGVGIDRRVRHDFVRQMTDTFAARDTFALAIPPEGTRHKGTHWKSGFYWIARSANVPIVLSYLDWGRREGGLGPSFLPTEDVDADVARIHAFYADKQGKFPADFTNISFASKERPAS